MKMTKFQCIGVGSGKIGTMWVKETNPYYRYYKQTLKTLDEMVIE